MRDTLKRRLRVVVPLVAVAGALLLIAWIGAKLRRAPVGPPDGDTSLLVLVHLRGLDGPVDRHQLLRVAFKGSEPQPPEVVWEGSPNLFYHGARRIIDGRYVVTATGGVIDTWEKRALHEGSGALIEITGDRIISGICGNGPTRERIVSFDLKTRKVKRLSGTGAEPFALCGRRSPDGTKSVTWPTLDSNLTLHRVGHAAQPLGRFRASAGPHSSDYPPPALWIDNERLLTQDGNGNLIAVALDGTRTPVVNVPAQTELATPPRLTRDADGHIIYTCGGEGFVIDVEAKTWVRCEWASLGHGFDATWAPAWPGQSTIRYQGKEIGDLIGWPHSTGHSACADGRIAIISEERRVQVWSAGTGKWTALDVSADQIVGWLK